MAHFSFIEKLQLIYLAIQHYIRAIKQKLIRLYVLKWRRSANLPKAIIFEPTDLQIADPTIAEDIYDGHISLCGTSFNIGANSPFKVIPPNQAWYNELVSFGWLCHFKALNSPIAIMQANALYVDWLNSKNYYSQSNWKMAITTKRLIALLSHSSILTNQSTEITNKLYFKTIDQHVQVLRRSFKYVKHSKDKLDIAIALCFANNCLNQSYQIKNDKLDYEQLLAEQLAEQILPDGGHVSRNPDLLLEIMLVLIPLKQTYKKQQKHVPIALQNAIDRIIPILHFFCHPDGNFIQFNGAGPTDWAAFLSIFDAEGEGFKAPTQAPHSGYYRLYAPDIQLTIDAGEIPKSEYSTTAHAGPLAVEISVSAQRMVVNCGATDHYDYKWFSTTRSTAAHSTLCLNNQSTATLKLPNWLSRLIGNQIYHGHHKMPVTIGKTPDGPQVIASHDGYARNFGLIHQRSITLSPNGEQITGMDILSPAQDQTKTPFKKQNYDIRFHLHPSVTTQTSRDGHSILLIMPNQDMWQFVSTFAAFRLEDSVYLGESQEKKKTHQIVISGQVEDYAEAKWQFRKL